MNYLNFAGGTSLDREGMDARSGNIAQRLVHHALPHHARYAGKGSAFDLNGEMRFARPVIAAVAMMLRAVIDDGKAGWRECRLEQHFHFNLGRTFFHAPLFPYGRFFAKENHGCRTFH